LTLNNRTGIGFPGNLADRFRLYDLRTILCVSLIIRLLAVVFSKGYGMHDDHFLVIEAAQSWADDYDYNNWLPKEGQETPTPSGHSFFYVGLHYLLFTFLKFIGLEDPQGKMVVIRFIHAVYSMITVYYGYKIAEKTGGKKAAVQVGWLLGLMWFWPFLCVRNLVEMVSIPVLVMATWMSVKDSNNSIRNYLIVGILLGIAFNIRFQCILFAGGFGLALFLFKKIKPAFATMAGFLLCAVLVQGAIDFGVWGHPFVEFKEYVRYNLEHAHTYGTQPWYNYFLLIGGILIPPISLFLLFGYFASFRRNLVLFLPAFVFLAFHSYFPNKQERFILPVIPFIILLGITGWNAFIQNSSFWQRRQMLLKYCWIFFWLLNLIPLSVVSFSYSKKNRVEAMGYLRSLGDVKGILIEDSNSNDFIMSPKFYLGSWVPEFGVTRWVSMDSVYSLYKDNRYEKQPNYVLFYLDKNLAARIQSVMKYHEITYLATIYPSFIDDLMFRLNPRNKNQITFIFKISGAAK